MWSGYVRNHLLPRIFGFELLMAPYAVAHFKLGMQLAGHDLAPAQREEWAYDFAGDERLGVFLTNTLEEAERKAETLFGPLRVITQEANAAAKIKTELPILAVIGNPPYSRDSYNKGAWLSGLMERYKVTVRREEIQLQALSDDYAKFICFAHHRIEKTGQGLVAFITNNGWLDGPLFRDMRKAIMDSFSGIWVLNLHGDSRKGALAPGGLKDENVFDIQQGVAIVILERTTDHTPSKHVYYGHLFGSREDKYRYLWEHSLEDDSWEKLTPCGHYWLFVPSTGTFVGEWQTMVSIAEIFKGQTRSGRPLPFFGAGFTTRHDDFAVALTEQELLKNVEEFLRPDATESELRERFSLCTTAHWSFDSAREKLTLAEAKKHLLRFLYRPFDFRYTTYTPHVIGEMRPEVMRHLTRENLALVSTRRVTGKPFDNFFVSRTLVEYKAGSHDGNTQVFPLYLYPASKAKNSGQADLGVQISHWPAGKGGRRPNLSPKFIADLEKRLGLKFVPEGRGDIFGTGVPPVGEHAQDARGTGVPPVTNHGQDAHATIRIRYGAYLPHWTREGATYAVCFRLADSLPESVVETWKFERDDIVKTAKQMNRPLSAHEQDRLHQLFSERVEKFLDEAQGECWMQREEVAAVVAGALRHFDGQRYRLVAWCVMPNHVHVIVQPLPGYDLAGIVHSWKSYSSKEANRALGRSGEFWQPEYYDHLIRDEQDLIRQIEYVLTNPLRAGLENWRWVGTGTGVPLMGQHGPEGHASHGQDARATSFGPEDVFNYIYAVFYSPTYRSRYAEFLKSDFPRVPLTSDAKLFRTLCGLGGELVALHLLESPRLSKPIARFPVKGSNLVEKGFPKYIAPGEPEPSTGKPLKEGRVYINAVAAIYDRRKGENKSGDGTSPLQKGSGQYFEGIPPEVWSFHIGGYQVCEKWLKDRRGRTLTDEDLEHYCKVVTALSETIRLMAEIDAAIPRWPID